MTEILRDFGISDGYFRQPSRTVPALPSRARCTAQTQRQRSSCDCPRRAHRPRPSSSAQPPPPATALPSGFRPSWLLGTTPGPSRIPWPIRSLRLSWRTSSNPHDHCRHLGCILPRVPRVFVRTGSEPSLWYRIECSARVLPRWCLLGMSQACSPQSPPQRPAAPCLFLAARGRWERLTVRFIYFITFMVII